MTATAHPTPLASPALSAPAAPFEPTTAPAPGGPFWLVFCVMTCSLFGALLGRLAPFSLAASPDRPHDPKSPGSFGDNPFAFLLHLVAIDWFRRFRSAPSTLEELRRRSRLARAVLSQPLAPVVPCDLPGENPTPGAFAPAFVGQLAAAPCAPLALTPTSFLNHYFASLSTPARAALSPHTRALFDDKPLPDPSATPCIAHSVFRITHSALIQSAIRNHQTAIVHSAFCIQHSSFLFVPI